MHLITNMMLKNPRLKRLLHYTTPDALDRPNISEDDSLKMFLPQKKPLDHLAR